MADFDIDPQFEQRLAGRLVEFADTAVRPFDAVEIADQARAGADRRSLRSRLDALLPRSGRPLLAIALLTVCLVGAGIFGGYIKLQNNSIAPNPSYQPFSPLPTVATASLIADASASPLATAETSASPIGTVLPIASPTPEPSASEVATVTPTIAPPTGPPTPEATPEPTPAPTPTVTAAPTPSPSPTPAAVNAFIAVTTGNTLACALADDGRVFCWGDNEQGQLGDGTTDARSSRNVPVVGIDDARAIAAGIRFACALRVDGTVWCWGEDPGSDSSSGVPWQVPGIDDATAITAGGAFACALRASGQIGCWGNGQLGQLGNGVFENNSGVPTPQRVLGIDDAIAVSAGWNHACAIRADFTVWCWGGNGDGATGYGQLGDGTLQNRASPVKVGGLPDAILIDAGGWTSCATVVGGATWCWGYGERGTLGDGNFTNSSVPVQVSGIDDAELLALGDFTACVSRTDESVWCWGDTSWSSGAPAGEPQEGNKTTPRSVAALANDHYCLLIDGRGQLWWWGSGSNQTPEPWPVGP